MILGVLAGIFFVWLIIFVIACGMYKDDIKDIIDNFKNSKGE